MARRTSRGKSSASGRDQGQAGDSEAAPASRAALRLSSKRKLATPTLLQQLALRPEFLEGIQLGQLLTPEPLRRRGQWVVRSQDLLSFYLELGNLRAETDANGAAVLALNGPGAATITLHFAPQHIQEQVFFAASKNPKGNEVDGHVTPNGQPTPSPTPTPLEPIASPPIGTRIANPSRLVFRFEEAQLKAAGFWPVPYTLAGILEACRALNLNVTANARYQPPPRFFKNTPRYRAPLVANVRLAYNRFSAAEKAAVLVSARRNEQLARRLGPEASSLLLRRAELAPAQAALQSTLRLDNQRAFTAAAAERNYLPTTAAALAASTSLAALDVAIKPGYKYLTVPRPKKPAPNETALELPFRLLLSPNGEAHFAHADGPEHSPATGHTSLWHTHLAEKKEAQSGVHQELDEPLRAVWARGGPESRADIFTDQWPADPETGEGLLGPDVKDPVTKRFPLFRQTLDDFDRYNIAHLSGNFALPGGRHEAINCQRLMLSSMGGWLDSRGDWKVPNGLSVEQWVHHAAQARDHYVRVLYKGYLLPFGHRVSLVKISERFFLKKKDVPPAFGSPEGNPAYLLQRMFLIVREPVRTFAETNLFKNVAGGKKQYYHRAFPFTSVRLLTEVTPDIADPSLTQIDNKGQALFWPSLPKASGAERFRFQYQATDLDGNQVQFDLPAVFIDNTLANPAGGVSGLHTRRHEAELRLRAAETNLNRLDDVIRELDGSLPDLFVDVLNDEPALLVGQRAHVAKAHRVPDRDLQFQRSRRDLARVVRRFGSFEPSDHLQDGVVRPEVGAAK